MGRIPEFNMGHCPILFRTWRRPFAGAGHRAAGHRAAGQLPQARHTFVDGMVDLGYFRSRSSRRARGPESAGVERHNGRL